MKRILSSISLVLALFLYTGCSQQKPADQSQIQESVPQEAVIARVAALKGPTAMGIVSMLEEDSQNDSPQYEATIYTSADEIVPLIVKGEVDIALIPTNLAATLYQKTNGAIAVIDINAGDVLYGVAQKDHVFSSVAELKGKTVYMTGKGTTPEWTIRYLLEKSGLTAEDVTLEFKSEPTEVVSLLAENPDAVAILPQPFATVATIQNEDLDIVYNLGAEWAIYGDADVQSGTVTGVTVVRRAFLGEHKDQVDAFIRAHADSVRYISDNPEAGAALVEQYDIAKAGPVTKVLKHYNPLLAVSGEEMRERVSGYLGMLNEISPDAVGGIMPDENFYYVG